MPNPRKIPGYILHKPSGQARVRLNGRDIYLGKFDSPESRAEYDRTIAEWLARGRGAPRLATVASQGADDLAVNELILAYLEFADGYYRKHGRPTAEPAKVRLACRPISRLYGETPARSFGPLALEVVRDAMVAAGLCRPEVNRRVAVVVRMFRWGVSKEMIPPAVHMALKAVPGLKAGRTAAREPEPVRPVADAAVDTVRAFVAPQVWAMVELQRLTGMRPGEAVIMRSGDVDRSGPVWVYRPGWHKTEHRGKTREVFLGPRAQAVLRPWLRADAGEYLFQPREWVAEQNRRRKAARVTPLTPSQRARWPKERPRKTPGARYTVKSYRKAVAAGCMRAGIPAWGPGRLRHSAASNIRVRFGLEAVQVSLGHAQMQTSEIYALKNRDLGEKVAMEMG